jgi:hypothetical protein
MMTISAGPSLGPSTRPGEELFSIGRRMHLQHVAGYERQRRHATLVAVALDLAASPRR